MSLNLLAKSVLIALLAALSAWAYLLVLSLYTGGQVATSGYRATMLYGSLIGSFSIGLPIALLTYWMSHRHLKASPRTLAMISLLAGVMMLLASYAIGDRAAAVMLGIPAFFAATTFGIFGWFWIVKPARETHE